MTSSYFPEQPRFIIEGPEGFLQFSEGPGLHWGPLSSSWRFLTRERADMVLEETGLDQHGAFAVRKI